MKHIKKYTNMLVGLVAGLWVMTAAAQLTTIFVPTAAGSKMDIKTRQFVEAARLNNAGTMVIEDHPGAAGAIGKLKFMDANPNQTVFVTGGAQSAEISQGLQSLGVFAIDNDQKFELFAHPNASSNFINRMTAIVRALAPKVASDLTYEQHQQRAREYQARELEARRDDPPAKGRVIQLR